MEPKFMATIEEDEHVMDYMDDLRLFLPQEEKKKEKNSKPNVSVQKRKVPWQQKAEEKRKRRKEEERMENELREKGLRNSISSTNIGYKLLQKMGFKSSPPAAPNHDKDEKKEKEKEKVKEEGKKGDKGFALPLNIEVKSGRMGLGMEEKMDTEKERRKTVQEMIRKGMERREKEKEDDFFTCTRRKWGLRRTRKDFAVAKRIWEEMEGIDVGKEEKKEKEKTKDKEKGDAGERGDERGEEKERRRRLKTNYHLVCNDDYDEIFEEGEGEGDLDEEKEEGIKEESEEEMIDENDLMIMLLKLREKYKYCLYCGFQYENEEKLLTECPGILESDH